MKKMFNEGNQIHNFMSCSGSGSNFYKVFVPVRVHTFEKVTVPVIALYLDHKRNLLHKFGAFFGVFT